MDYDEISTVFNNDWGTEDAIKRITITANKRFVAMSDIHLSKLNRLRDVVDTCTSIVNYCIENDYNTLFILGDIYEKSVPTKYEQTFFDAIVKHANSNGIRVIIILGNHDIGGALNYNSVIELEVLQYGLTEVVTLPTVVDIEDLQIVCIPFIHKKILSSMKLDYRSTFLKTMDKIWDTGWMGDKAYLFSHFTFQESSPESGFLPPDEHKISIKDLSKGKYPGLETVIVGDIHKFQQLYARDDQYPDIWHIGAIDRFTIADKSDKVFMVHDGYNNFRFDHTDAKDLIEMDVHTSELEDIDSFKTQYPEIKDNILKLTINGTRKEINDLDLRSLNNINTLGVNKIKLVMDFTDVEPNTSDETTINEKMTDEVIFSNYLDNNIVQMDSDMKKVVFDTGIEVIKKCQ